MKTEEEIKERIKVLFKEMISKDSESLEGLGLINASYSSAIKVLQWVLGEKEV